MCWGEAQCRKAGDRKLPVTACKLSNSALNEESVYFNYLMAHAPSGGEETCSHVPPAPESVYLTGGEGIIPGKTYACRRTIKPTMAASTMECQKTLRKIGPKACERS